MEQTPIDKLPLLDETSAELYDLVLRLHPDGITYTLSRTRDREIVGCDRVFFVPTNEGIGYTTRLSDLIYAYSFLPLPYHSVRIAYDASAFVLVPPGMPIRESEEEWLSMALPIAVSPQDIGYTKTYSIASECPTLLAAWERDAFAFLRRTYPYAEIVPYVVPTLQEGLSRSRVIEERVVALLVSPLALNILVLDRGQIRFANRFALIGGSDPEAVTHEILYYLGSVWQQMGEEALAREELLLYHTTSQEMADKVAAALDKILKPLGHTLHSSSYSPF